MIQEIIDKILHCNSHTLIMICINLVFQLDSQYGIVYQIMLFLVIP